MRKLLFAAVDARNGEALRAVLQVHQNKWSAQVVVGSHAAQGCLTNPALDGVVADLSTVDGRSLMSYAREIVPEVVRIGIVTPGQSGFAHLSAVHQTVFAPLNFKDLEMAVERSCRLRDLLRGERICKMLGELGQLPSAPAVYVQLMQKLNQPDISVGEIADIVERDAATSAKLLQVVNSVVFRTSREIATVKTAVSFLGLDVVKNVILSLEAFQAFGRADVLGFSLEDLQGHCRLTAAIVSQMELAGEAKDAAIVAALLHDVGKLAIAYKMPDRFVRLLARARAEKQPLFRIEEELWGITHAEIGAYLLGLWGLPIQVTEAIAYHHSPASVPHQTFDSLAAVYVANLLSHEIEDAQELRDWDIALLEGLGVMQELPAWRKIARQVAQEQSSQSASGWNAKQRVPVA